MTDTTQDPFAAPPDAQPEALPRAMPDFTSLSFHKVALIAGLAIATIVPNMLISNLVEEREQRQSGVREEFTRNWGPEQTVLGPVLVIPYQAGERPRTYVRIAAAKLDLAATLNPQERRRGLFSATVYDATLDMQGAFVVPAEARLRELVTDKDGRFIWNEAAIALGTRTRLTGLSSSDNITVDGTPTAWVPCLEALRPEAACKGADMVLAKAPLPLANEGDRVTFKGRVSLRGTGQFAVVHAAKEMSAVFRSSWPSPSFVGRRTALELDRLGRRLRGEMADDGVRLATHHDRERGCRAIDVEYAVHRRRSHPGDADLPHDQSRGEVRPAFHRAVVRDLLFLRGAVAAAHPRRAIRPAWPLAVAVLAAVALARGADRLHQRLSRGRRPRARCNRPSTPRRSRGASCRRSSSP